MNHSKAGKALKPLIAEQTAKIYQTDKRRYNQLIYWVWLQQKQGWPDEAIAEALKLSQPGIHEAYSWWKYLTSLLKKAKGRASEAEATAHKSADMAIAGELVEFLRMRAGKR